MNSNEEIIIKENAIEEKKLELEKLRKSWWKIGIISFLTVFILPYIPLRNGQLIDKYGYFGAVLFGVLVSFTIIPIVFIFHINTSDKEIEDLERDLVLEKRSKNFEK